MPSIFSRKRSTTCFFCQTAIQPPPRNPKQFQCPSCSCWNRYDARGEIASDEPAMHDEALNEGSFVRRGSPNKNHLPSVHRQTPSLFCHTCLTNQTLLVNLLSNYLPSPEDPTYQHRLANLPEYEASLQLRYPPLCPNCRPVVEEEIAKRNDMARVRALGFALNTTQGKGKEKIVEQGISKQTFAWEMFIWRLRGCLWAFTTLVSILLSVAGTLNADPLYESGPRRISFLILSLLSLAWIFWDPTYTPPTRRKRRGKELRLEKRRQYFICQFLIWISRTLLSSTLVVPWLRPEYDYFEIYDLRSKRRQALFTSHLILELVILVFSLSSFHIYRPPTIRLIDTSQGLKKPNDPNASSKFAAASVPNTLSEPDLFATLSLSSNPVITNFASNPIFGRPSLTYRADGQLNGPDDNVDYLVDEEGDPDAMDWEPTEGDDHRGTNQLKPLRLRKPLASAQKPKDNDLLLRPQRFFPPEQPTGLENLLMKTRLVDDEFSPQNQIIADQSPRSSFRSEQHSEWNWKLAYLLSIIPLVAVLVYLLWIIQRS